MPDPGPRPERAAGLAAALGAFVIWGLTPLYFKQVDAVAPLDLVAHRIAWSVPFLAIVVTLGRGWAAIGAALASRRTMAILAVTTLIIGGNWFLFTWAIVTGRVVEAALGYFLGPLVSIALGVVVLHEKLDRRRAVAVLLAGAAVLYEATRVSGGPSAALLLGASFAVYALIRKRIRVDAVTGLLIETLYLLPLAAGWILVHGGAGLGRGEIGLDLLILVGGTVTTTPLLLFTIGSRRLDLTTIGFLQYIAPSISLLLGVAVYGEPFGWSRAITFAGIWAAILLASLPRRS
ncbi:chloramphenicol resistance permease RarD [Allostella sp. ATCC 35155]|nr:chloramphenicol resistance permease RarD [Stella sp. ATCC 35155]